MTDSSELLTKITKNKFKRFLRNYMTRETSTKTLTRDFTVLLVNHSGLKHS